MDPLDLVKLTGLMERTSGNPQLKIGLIDGPVVTRHPDLAGAQLLEIPGNGGAACSQAGSASCLHGTFVAGILSAKRGSPAPAICPGCTLLIRPIFPEAASGSAQMPSATPAELARAILDCLHAGARVLNMSAAIALPSLREELALTAALDQAAKRGVIVVAAAGNQGTLGSTAITRHPWVIPVAACNPRGKVLDLSNLGGSIGRRGLAAPGLSVTSLGAQGTPLTLGGTSAAAPFVTGTVALLWSEFPRTSAADLKFAITQAGPRRRVTVVPPLLDASESYQYLLTAQAGRRSA